MNLNQNKAIIFYCDWSNHPEFQFAEFEEKKTNENKKLIVDLCSSRISLELVLEALQKGAKGVLIACCPPGECEHNGNYKTIKRILLLKRMLKDMGINPDRVKLEYIEKAQPQKFKKAVDNFMQELETL